MSNATKAPAEGIPVVPVPHGYEPITSLRRPPGVPSLVWNVVRDLIQEVGLNPKGQHNAWSNCQSVRVLLPGSPGQIEIQELDVEAPESGEIRLVMHTDHRDWEGKHEDLILRALEDASRIVRRVKGSISAGWYSDSGRGLAVFVV